MARTPNKASSNGGAIDETASSSGGSKAGQDRELASFAAARQRRLTSTTPVPGAGPSEDRPQAAAQPEQATALAPDCTTYQESFNLRDYYPGLYERALLDTRADPVKNYTLISEYGDSLRAVSSSSACMHPVSSIIST